MSSRLKYLIVTLVIALPAFLFGRVIWPDPLDATQPFGLQIPLFMILAMIESLVLGFGIAYLIFNLKTAARKHPNVSRGESILAFIALVWLLVSWWPHDNMHRANGMDLNGLLRIEYIFHVTLIIAALILARFFVKVMRGTANAQLPGPQ
jgi:hypothetical protein